MLKETTSLLSPSFSYFYFECYGNAPYMSHIEVRPINFVQNNRLLLETLNTNVYFSLEIKKFLKNWDHQFLFFYFCNHSNLG